MDAKLKDFEFRGKKCDRKGCKKDTAVEVVIAESGTGIALSSCLTHGVDMTEELRRVIVDLRKELKRRRTT